jgi:hypothetical protein
VEFLEKFEMTLDFFEVEMFFEFHLGPRKVSRDDFEFSAAGGSEYDTDMALVLGASGRQAFDQTFFL